MSDIVERLRKSIDRRAGTGDSDVNAFAIPVEVRWGDVTDAIAEIERLRATIESLRQIAGAASIELPLMTFADIKKEVRDGKDAKG